MNANTSPDYVFNNDGLIAFDVHLSTGSGFVLRPWGTEGAWFGGTSWPNYALFLTGDFNGDGKTDIAYAFNDGGRVSIDVHAAAASRFVNRRWTTPSSGWLGGDYSTFLTGDFNSDGMTDIAYVFNENGNISIEVKESNGGSFSPRKSSNQGAWLGGPYWSNRDTFLAGDFDGDGKTDIAHVFRETGGISVDVLAARPEGFEVRQWAPPCPVDAGPNWVTRLLDLNGLRRGRQSQYCAIHPHGA